MDYRTWIPDSRLGWVARALLAVAFICFAWVAWVVADTALVGAYQNWRLESALAGQGAPAGEAAVIATRVAPKWGAMEEGDLVGRIDIERIDVSAMVLHGISARTLRRAVGFIPGTARPGEGGNVGVAGHRDSFFRELGGVESGDHITLPTLHGVFEYVVDSTMVVGPRDVHVLDPPGIGELLTLVTCYPFYFVGPAPDRFIVHATRVDGADAPAPDAPAPG
jgi:sortase A